MDDLALITGQIFLHEGEKCCEIVKIVTGNDTDSFTCLSESDFINQIKAELGDDKPYRWFTAVVKARTEMTHSPLGPLEYEDIFEIYEVNDVQEAFHLIRSL